jgi:hypothetical protein
MKARAVVILAASIVLLGTLLATHSFDKPYSKSIVDVSWPNCKTAPANTFGAGIIGVNGGLDFHPNPCLAQETAWFGQYALYINTGYPGSSSVRKFPASPKHCRASDKHCLAYNYGYNATIYAINYANLQNAHARQWWLDVETDNSWTNNFLVNRASLQGVTDAIKQKVLFSTVGIYSSPNQWYIITGKWQNKLPVWIAAGTSSKAIAAKACGAKPFTGGTTTQLSQYTTGLDENLSCL